MDEELTDGELRAVRVNIGIVDYFGKILRDILTEKIPATDLYKTHVRGKRKKSDTGKKLGLWEDIFNNGGHLDLIKNATDYSDFDITLLYTLLRNFCSWATNEEPTSGWGVNKIPATGEETIGDDIERIRLVRNKFHGHCSSYKISNDEYTEIWEVITDVCKRMEQRVNNGSYHQGIKQLEQKILHRDLLRDLKKEVEKVSSESKSNKYEIFKKIEILEETGRRILFWCIVPILMIVIAALVLVIYNMYLPDKMSKTGKANERQLRDIQKDKILQEWKEKDKKFYRTRACEEAERKLRTSNTLTIIGNSGSGKTVMAQHIALRYEKDGYHIFPADSFKDINTQMNHTEKQIFVLHDPVGKNGLDENAESEIRKYEKSTQEILIHSTIKLIFTSRKVVINDKKLQCRLLTSNIVDIDEGIFRLSQEEKRQILGKHIVLANIDNKDFIEIIKTERYFPLLCYLYGNNEKYRKSGVAFFKEFGGIIREEIKHFQNSDKGKFCALVLVSLYEHGLEESVLKNLKHEPSKEFKEMYESCGLARDTPRPFLLNELTALNGSYVQKVGTLYRFSHDYIAEVTTYMLGSINQSYMIKHCPLSFLLRSLICKSMTLPEMSKKQETLTVEFDENNTPVLVERIISEIKKGNYFDAFLIPCFREKYIIDEFISKLDDSLIENLLKLQSHNMENPKLCVTYRKFTKQDFLKWSNKKVSPLHQLVIYNYEKIVHAICNKTDHSRLKQYELFPASCASGSSELIKYTIDKLGSSMHDKWNGNLTCLQIAALFNYDNIVKFLLQRRMGDANYLSYGWTPLSLASLYRFGSNEIKQKSVIQTLISYKADVNKRNSDGSSPLYYAAYGGYDSIVTLLLAKNANVTMRNEKGESALYVAAMKGRKTIVKILLKNKADVNMFNQDSATPLYIAVEKGHYSVVEILLKYSADVNMFNIKGASPLYIAALQGYDSIVKMLIQNNADVNKCENMGYSPLYIAAKFGRYSVVKILLDNKATIDMRNNGSIGLFFKAAYNGPYSLDKIQLNDIANISNILQGYNVSKSLYDEGSPLHIAARLGYYSVVKVLLDKKADVNMLDKHGVSPLYIAAENGRDSVVKILLDNKANVNICLKDGASPLHIAAQRGYYSIVKMLLDNKALVNIRDKKGASPLHKTVMNGYNYAHLIMDNEVDISKYDREYDSPFIISAPRGHSSIVKVLLDNNAEINMPDNNGASPLCMAAKSGYDSVVNILLDNKAEVNMCGNKSVSPLYIATRQGHYSIVKMLLDKKADVDKSDNNGESPLYIAAMKCFESIVKALLDNNADVNKCNKYGISPLSIAAEYGHDSVVKILLDNKADVNILDKDDISPLLIAARRGHSSIVRMLLDKKADVNTPDNKGVSPLYIAAMNGHDSIVKMLLDNKADVYMYDKNDVSPLHIAAQQGYYSIVRMLLDNNADVNSGASPRHISPTNTPAKMFMDNKMDLSILYSNSNGVSPLYMAARRGHYSIVKMLLDNKADVNMRDNNGVSPLYIAAMNGHDSVVKKLVEYKADVNICDNNGVSPLLRAAEKGHDSVVKILLDNKADVNISGGSLRVNSLYMAARRGHFSIVKMLLDNKADLNMRDKNGASPLYIAAMNGHDSIVKILLNNTADVNMTDNNKFTPLYIASKNGHASVVKMLLDNKADINVIDKSKFTPLYIASKNGHDSVVKILLDNNADINMCDEDGVSPLFIAAKKGHDSVVQIQLDINSAVVDNCDINGASPLYVAAENGYESVAKTLLDNKANVNMSDNNGDSPLCISAHLGYYSVVQTLLDYNADIYKCNKNGFSAIDLAERNGRDSVFKLLSDNGAKRNSCGNIGV